MKIKTYRIHNYLAHPAMQFFYDLSTVSEKMFSRYGTMNTIVHSLSGKDIPDHLIHIGNKIHAKTLPNN